MESNSCTFHVAVSLKHTNTHVYVCNSWDHILVIGIIRNFNAKELSWMVEPLLGYATHCHTIS